MMPETTIEGNARSVGYNEALKDPALRKILSAEASQEVPAEYAGALAGMEDGLVIVVEPNARAKITVERKLASGGAAGTFFIFGENSHSTVFYRTALPEGGSECRGLFLSRWAVAHCCFLQSDSGKAVSAVGMVARLGEGSQLKFLNSNLGGKERRDAFLFLQDGRASRCEHFEAGLAKQGQKFFLDSNHLHLAPDTYSRSVFKYATAGNSQVNVDGKVTIEQTAPGSDTHLLAKSLLLSENAVSKVIPMLFVRNSEVAAGHGSSMTPLQDEELFYLHSRGIGESESRRMVLQGFLRDLLARSEMDAGALGPLEAELEKDALGIFPRD